MKINQRIGLIRRIRNLLPLQARVALYNALILPLFDYGDVIWEDKNNDTIMSELQILQNKAAKVMLGQPPRSSSTETLKKSGFEVTVHKKVFSSLHCNPQVSLLEKPISTLILLKVKLFIHIIQDALMIFAYPYPEQTGVNKLLFFTPRKTGTAFQMI